MNTRLAVFVIGLLLLSLVVLSLIDIVLPDSGIILVGPVIRVPAPGGQDILPPLPGREPNRILGVPVERGLRPPGFFLRPFGLHREGLPGISWHLGSFASVLILAIIALYAAPRRVAVLAQVISNGWGQRLMALAIGLLGYLGIALLGFLIFINVVGWPLLAILTGLTYLATALGLVAVSLALGAGVCRFVRLTDRSPLFHLTVGVVLLFLGSIIPFVGWAVFVLSALFGFGAILWTRAGGTTGWSLEEARI